METPHQHTALDVWVNPLLWDGVVFQRRTRRIGVNVIQHPDRLELAILITVLITHHHTLPDGTPGEEAPILCPRRMRTYMASNREVLDLATSPPALAFERVQETDAEWLAKIADDARPLLRRGDAYEAQMNSGAQDMVGPVQAAMESANQAPYFIYGDPADGPATQHALGSVPYRDSFPA
ncbi:hypothetical protein [Hymenobacter rubidus]|uniref:hypothetical protein n=1 Tax=Hymenobacter rubidus TaxID=1441626 RepID=UPI00191FBBDB|nr:hypothetical protein [Hymenobacter rubidus]